MPYSYVGKGTIVLGLKNKHVEDLRPGDKVLGFYIGPGMKKHVESRVKSIRYIGKVPCKMAGSIAEHVLAAPGQKTIGPGFKAVEIDDVIYNVSSTIPRPIKVHKEIDNVDIYEIVLEDDDVVPLLTSYMFVVYSNEPINFQVGGSGGEKNSEKQSGESNKQSNKQSETEKKETNETRRTKSRKKRKSKRNESEVE